VVAVVVPAHNEEALIGACVAAVRRAAEHPEVSGIGVHLVVVADDCRDATAQRAAEALAVPPGRLDGTVVAVAGRNVGRARALGVAQAWLALEPTDPEAVWLASTDADSVVPYDWLAHHMELRDAGADGCAGTVIVDSWVEHPVATEAAFAARYHGAAGLDFGHSHVHGTNLGVSMAAYLEAGGWSPLVSGEDHALWEGLTMAGRTLVATPGAPVTTSGRRYGRSPAGFAQTLRRLGAVPA
jgi:cellulose synthase/poly-beta-1,6-N-acetylglucosamine synthase-like glycosyltransferase